MSELEGYEVVVVGGGPAGMTTALYTTRLGHRTAVVDEPGGRHMRVAGVHNLVGVSEDTSGAVLDELGTAQLEEYGGDHYADTVANVRQTGDGFEMEGEDVILRGERLVLATGFDDVTPDIPGLKQFTGRGLHYCLHCDAYTLVDEPVFVMGHDEEAATVAMLMLNFTGDVNLLLHGSDPEWGKEVEKQLAAHPVTRVDAEVTRALPSDGDGEWLGGFEFADGKVREYEGGFAMYGQDYNAELAAELGCELNDDGSVSVDDNRETSVDGVYAVGDLTHGQNQAVIAMGDGAYAGMAIHKNLREFPRPPDEGQIGVDEVPAMSEALRVHARQSKNMDKHAGLQPADK